MTEFENILQECLHDLEQDASNVDECLQRYPQYAGQLEPILVTSAYLARGRAARLSPAFKRRVRTRLLQQIYAHPRKTAHLSFTWTRLAASLAVLMLALLVSGTVYAQRALPGEAFYTWKLASEDAWRVLSPDPIETDLAIAERRLNELILVRDNPALQVQTLAAYRQVTDRLRAQVDAANEARILAALDSQIEKLDRLGILPDQPDPTVLPPLESSTSTPPVTPLPILKTPPVLPTDLPQILPTVEVVPKILPTVPKPPKIIPTIKIPPSIP